MCDPVPEQHQQHLMGSVGGALLPVQQDSQGPAAKFSYHYQPTAEATAKDEAQSSTLR